VKFAISNYAGETGRMNDSVSVMSLLLVIGIVVTLLLVVVLRKRKREGKAGETDYRAFFIMGVAFLPTGFAMMMVYFLAEIPFEIGLPLFALGLIYLIIGLANRDKWKKTE
jgi:LPXTG-motif cell wall-anchored protein